MGTRVNCPACGYFDKDTMFPHAHFGMFISDDARDIGLSSSELPRGPRMYVCRCGLAVWIDVEALAVVGVAPDESGGVWFTRSGPALAT